MCVSVRVRAGDFVCVCLGGGAVAAVEARLLSVTAGQWAEGMTVGDIEETQLTLTTSK